ncbi:ABC transporter permease [Luteipulveratus flavus]|uniref:ABC transporter permease n=1 Tax=Luteipulveratus flavus TaxID=3031728 RepID=A0ABT6C1Q0_9MICO|nr:ABC transporter permease [Luteipulveratus sp. YIM 133296]MDF8262814.1 ABC transporter permease [Luteipulveratus sp. YIM 133296]
MINQIWTWLTDGANWSGDDGITHRLVQHLWYSGLSLLIAGVIALPLGTWIAHSGRASWLVTAANSLRAVPSLGLLFAASMLLSSKFTGDTDLPYLVPSIIVLTILAIPPLLAGAYSGVREVDPAARDAARGMGMTGGEVLRQVELPNALPLIFSGLRSATLQVIATATIAAYIGLGGLGAFLRDGIALNEYDAAAGASVLVAVLALAADLLLGVVQRLVVSPGLRTTRTRTRRNRRADATPAAAALGPTNARS